MSVYDYHMKMQSHQIIASAESTSGNGYTDKSNAIIPPWSAFNRFYHFSDDASDIILHDQEIYDPMNNAVLIPCGNVRINRTFIINPGHRIIFKFSIWKNDLTIVNDTSDVAQALQVPVLGSLNSNPDNKELDMLSSVIENLQNTINQQNELIANLNKTIEDLRAQLEDTHHHKHHKDKDSDKTEDATTDTTIKNCDCDEEHQSINSKIEELENQLEEVKTNNPADSETIADLQNQISEMKEQVTQIEESNPDMVQPISDDMIEDIFKDL
jgi:hypothetical protein